MGTHSPFIFLCHSLNGVSIEPDHQVLNLSPACLAENRYRYENLFAGEPITGEQVREAVERHFRAHGRTEVLVYLMQEAPRDGKVTRFREELEAMASMA